MNEGPSAVIVATVQVGIAGFALWSSSRDVLSDGACVGGLVGTFGNLALLALAGVALTTLSIRERGRSQKHPATRPLALVCAAALVAIPIALTAALRCTV